MDSGRPSVTCEHGLLLRQPYLNQAIMLGRNAPAVPLYQGKDQDRQWSDIGHLRRIEYRHAILVSKHSPWGWLMSRRKTLALALHASAVVSEADPTAQD